ncbi:MAG: sulfatase [Planctomycetota bacterium]
MATMFWRVALILLVTRFAIVSTNAQSPKVAPDVLFIAVDDLNDWIGCLGGHPQSLTPNMDRLASRGVLFTNAHCAAPACNPSRATVFSGRMPGVTGVWSNESASLDKTYPNGVSLSQSFARAGYRTLGTGKLLHRGAKLHFQDYFETQQRWSPLSKDTVNYAADELPSKATDNPRHLVETSRGEAVVLPLNRMPSDRKPNAKSAESFDWGPWDVPDEDFGDTRITDWAIKTLAATREKPLFLGVGYYRPHIPLWAPRRFFDRFKETPASLPHVLKSDLADLSATAKRWAREPITAGSHSTVVRLNQWRAAVEAYLACITYVDEELGRLIDALDRSPSADRTWIVLWSDHGWHLGEKEHWGKWTAWERSTRVPLIVVPPKNQASEFAGVGQRCRRPVSLIDLYPTLIDVCGIKSPERLDGQSLASLLRDPNLETKRSVVTTLDEGNVAIRSQRYRYIRYVDGTEELYDLVKDPNEWVNVARSAKHRAVFEAMAARAASIDHAASIDEGR